MGRGIRLAVTIFLRWTTLLSKVGDHIVDRRIEKVGSDSGGEDCSIFYLEVTGEAVLIRGRRNAISIYILVANSFTPDANSRLHSMYP